MNIYKTRFLIVILLIFLFNINGFAAENGQKQEDFNPKNNSKIPLVIELKDPLEIEQSQLFFPKDVFKEFNIQQEEYRESPFRRAEIIFFIAYPYVYMYNLVILETIMKTNIGAKMGLGTYHYVFILILSGIVSGLIAYDDNVFVYSSKAEKLERQKKLSDRFDFRLMLYKF